MPIDHWMPIFILLHNNLILIQIANYMDNYTFSVYAAIPANKYDIISSGTSN